MKSQIVIVELAGPAGVGKTTIRNALSKSNGTMQFTPVPQIRQLHNLPFFLWNFILLLPVFFAVYQKQKQALTFELIVKLAILNGWLRRLQADHQKDLSVMILDQGPVYMLAELLRHGPTNFCKIVPKWWERVCKGWTNVLDLVICLDSPDAILLQRNRTRQKSHGIKKNPDEWGAQFLARSRAAQAEVLTSMIETHGKMKVKQVDTTESLDETVQRIFTLINEQENAN